MTIKSTQAHLLQDIDTQLSCTVLIPFLGIVGTVLGGSGSVGFGFFNSTGT